MFVSNSAVGVFRIPSSTILQRSDEAIYPLQVINANQSCRIIVATIFSYDTDLNGQLYCSIGTTVDDTLQIKQCRGWLCCDALLPSTPFSYYLAN